MSELDKTSSRKDRGEVAELAFRLEARKRGLLTSKFEEGFPLDFVLYNPAADKFFKVQVKSCYEREPRGTFKFSTRVSTAGEYDHKLADVFAIYIFQTDEWFLIPAKEVVGCPIFRFKEGETAYNHKNNWNIFGCLSTADKKDAGENERSETSSVKPDTLTLAAASNLPGAEIPQTSSSQS